jgi:nucleotide-binding universal stress UspA family protein
MVVAGVDGSPAARAALHWATSEAALSGAGLTICHVSSSSGLTGHLSASAHAQDEILDHAVATASHHLDRSRISAVAAQGDTARALIQLSRRARGLVVGTHGYVGLAARVCPPIAARVIAGAGCPVVVQTMLAGVSGPFAGHVVVGVDGSAPARRALEFGFAHAAARGLPLAAVHVTDESAPDYWTDDTTLETCFVNEAFVAAAAEPFEARYPDVPVKRAVFSNRVATGLIRAASGAALLVLGDRGRGRAVRTILGSMTDELVGAAICPTAVIPSGARED